MTAPRTYDHLGRLQRISATPTSGLGWDFDDTYNQANQRVRTAHREGSAWQYDYDGLGQLTSGRKPWADGTPVPRQQREYAYDDWNLLAELDGEDNVLRSFLWGTDLSGSMQGAGGVGGLLAVDDSEEGCLFAAYDGTGNFVRLVDATDGCPSASYDYDPFGQRLRGSRDAASANPFQFSTKYLNPETGISYYGHRFYNPSLGRWLSRDPSGLNAFDTLYSFVRNNPAADIDYLGLDCLTCGSGEPLVSPDTLRVI